jgi:hypothetical protein
MAVNFLLPWEQEENGDDAKAPTENDNYYNEDGR